MKLQTAPFAVHLRQPGALHNIDRGTQLARLKQAVAATTAIPGRAGMFQRRRQLMVCGGVQLACIVKQKDPASLKAHQLYHRGQRIVERRLDVGGTIQRFGDMIQNEEFAIALEQRV
jgi:hypothetical protein